MPSISCRWGWFSGRWSRDRWGPVFTNVWADDTFKADIAGVPMEVYSTLRMASNLATQRGIEILTGSAHKIRIAVHYYSRGKASFTVQVHYSTAFSPELIVWTLDADILIKLCVTFLNHQLLKLWPAAIYSLDWQARFVGCKGYKGTSDRAKTSWLVVVSHNFWDAILIATKEKMATICMNACL